MTTTAAEHCAFCGARKPCPDGCAAISPAAEYGLLLLALLGTGALVLLVSRCV